MAAQGFRSLRASNIVHEGKHAVNTAEVIYSLSIRKPIDIARSTDERQSKVVATLFARDMGGAYAQYAASIGFLKSNGELNMQGIEPTVRKKDGTIQSFLKGRGVTWK